MGRPIRAIPTLRGKNSKHFQDSLLKNGAKITAEEKKRIDDTVNAVLQNQKASKESVSEQQPLKIGDYLFEQLDDENQEFSFDCGDEDINSYFRNDAMKNQRLRKANTYVFTERKRNEIVAFFSISNSSVPDAGYFLINKSIKWFINTRKKPTIRSIWRNIRYGTQDWFTFDSRELEYPAVLISRLGVNTKYQRRRLGSQILDFIKGWIERDNKSAFRLLILDPYNLESHITYYSKNGFYTLLEEDKDTYTRLLYFDMKKTE